MAESKSKTVKKVTQIPEANVTIEVEQKEEDSAPEETVPTPEENEKIEETQVQEAQESPIGGSLDDLGEDDSSSFGWKKVFLFTTVAAVIGFLILGGFLYLKGNYKLTLSKESETNKTIDIPAVSPTPTPEPVDKSAYKIQVLNGSGIAGEAAVVQKTLEDGGFTVSAIGNAATQDFTKTQISASETVSKSYVDELEKTLKERGAVEVVKAPASQTEDVVVTVGSDVNESPTPTP